MGICKPPDCEDELVPRLLNLLGRVGLAPGGDVLPRRRQNHVASAEAAGVRGGVGGDLRTCVRTRRKGFCASTLNMPPIVFQRDLTVCVYLFR